MVTKENQRFLLVYKVMNDIVLEILRLYSSPRAAAVLWQGTIV
jgi:hypothetical protein